MEIISSFKHLKIIFLFLLVMLFFQQEGISQKNIIKVTPIKVLFEKSNISYERAVSDRWAVLIDFQGWFIKNKERDRQSIYGIEGEPVLESNKGSRISLAVRKYFSLKKSAEFEFKYFHGLGGFLGRHTISMKRHSYSYETGWYNGTWNDFVVLPDLRGEVELISGGTYLDLGFQIKLSNFLRLELGAITGYALINKKDDFLTLSDYTPYVLEEDRVTFNQKYKSGIEGLYIEPMLNLGFSF